MHDNTVAVYVVTTVTYVVDSSAHHRARFSNTFQYAPFCVRVTFTSLVIFSSFNPSHNQKGTTSKKKQNKTNAEKELQYVFFSPFGQTVVQTLIRMVDVRVL